MASGNTLCVFTATAGVPPSSNYATLDTRNSQPVLEFDAATDESIVFEGILPSNYSGGGITCVLQWAGDTATTGDVMWTTEFERRATDMDSDSFATVVAGAAASCNGTSGIPTYTSIAHTDGAQIDSLAVGEGFRFRVTRDANHASDTMAGDAVLIAVLLKET